MKKRFLNIALILGAIFILLISVYINIFVGVLLIFTFVTICSFIKYPQAITEQLILLGIFLAPCSNIFVYETEYFDMKILQFLWMIIFMFILIQKALLKDRDLYRKSNTNNSFIFVLYLIGLSISCLFSINMSLSLKELFQYSYLFLMMFVIYKNAQKKDFFDKIIITIVLSNFFLVSISLISYFTGKMLIPAFHMYQNGHIEILDNLYKSQALVESNNIINRIDSVMGLYTISIANCILVQSLIVNYKIRNSTGKQRGLYFILFIANLVTLTITYSRAALLIFLVVNFITLLGKNHKLNLLLIVLALCSIPLTLSMFPIISERILEAFNPQEGSTKYHFVYWIVALREGYDHILTGIGLGNAAFQQDMYVSLFNSLFRKYDLYKSDGANIHNFILQIWAEQGSFGLFANVILIFSPIVHFLRNKFVKKSIIGRTVYDYIILAYVATLAYNLTNNNFYIETFWILAALTYACKDSFPYSNKINNDSLMNGEVCSSNNWKTVEPLSSIHCKS